MENNDTFNSNKEKVLVKGFKRYNLNKKIDQAIKNIGYKQPTPIQKRTIPEILNGNNVIVKSRTGSGKSAAFIIPILQQLAERKQENENVEVAVLSPSRELAKQTLDFFLKLSKGLNLKFAVMTGGDKIEKQFERLQNKPDVVIATPGRLCQHLVEGSVSLNKVRFLVIDEADKLFEQGFEEQIKQILKSSPAKKQIALFSATIPDNLANFMKIGIQEYKYVSLDEEIKVPKTLKIHALFCREEEKMISLVAILKFVVKNEKVLIFCPTKQHCEFLSNFLYCYNISSSFIFGKMDQVLRDTNLHKFKNDEENILIVTDLAARGLDIPKLDLVINYDFPDRPKLFIHRIGRTARADQSGRVITLVSTIDLPYLVECQEFINRPFCFDENEIKGMNQNEYISIGSIPKDIYKSVEEMISEYHKNKIDLEDLQKSMVNSLEKKSKFKQKIKSKHVKKAKELVSEIKSVSSLFSKTNHETGTLLALQLKEFKPKKSIFEHLGNDTIKAIDKFKDKLNKIKISAKEKNSEEEKDFLVNCDETVKVNKVELNENNSFLNKKIKRSQVKSFKSSQFINNVKVDEESKRLWGKEQPLDLNEITLNLCPDEDQTNKGNSKYAWNTKLNKFVSGKADKDGNLVMRNESGVKIKKDEKRPSLFKKWLKTSRNKGSAIETFNGKKKETKDFNTLVKQRKDASRKVYKYAGQMRKLKEKKIGDKVHQNRKSFAIVKRRKK
jgi:ATP-dependent RNA helicase DDX54/DBP10